MRRESIQQAEDMIRLKGERITPARTQVLGVLLEARRPLTHHEIEKHSNRLHAVDRVTIYRVLEWLTRRHLAHKIAGDDRVWLFNADTEHESQQHAHFKCNDCGSVFCLKDMSTAYAVNLPPGYRSQQMELTIRGLCAECPPKKPKEKIRSRV